MRGRKRRSEAQDPEDEGGEAGEAAQPTKEPKTTQELVRTVKLSLSKVMVKTETTENLLKDLLLFCNQVRVMATLVAKYHIFTLLQDGTEELPFAPDQNYFSHCMTVARGTAIKDTKKMKAEGNYKASLTKAAEYVRNLFPAPVYSGKLSDSGVCQILLYFAKQLAENLSTHLTTHHEDVLQVWLKNEIRGEVMAKNPGVQGTELQKLIKAKKDAIKDSHDDPLGNAFDLLDGQITAMAEEKKLANQTRKLIAAFYGLQVSAGKLQNRHNTQFKLFSVLPEAAIAISPITVDRRVMLHLFNTIHYTPRVNKNGEPSKVKAPVMVHDDELDPTNWDALFNMQEIHKLRKGDWEFVHSVMTDGVALSVRFAKEVPRTQYVAKEDYVARAIDLSRPGLYSDQNTVDPVELKNANLVGLDPGINSILTAVRVADVDTDTLKPKVADPRTHAEDRSSKPLVLTQAHYSEESMLRYKQKKSGTLTCKQRKKRGRKKHNGKMRRWVRRQKKERIRKSYAVKVPLATATAVLQAAPSPKRVELHKYEEYLRALASVWRDMWAYHGTIKRRKVKFFVYRRRESFMTRIVNSFEEHFGPNPVILFGNGADNGLFGRLRGGGVKGPVKEFKRRLAERYCVIGCSEFRSSKLCVHCGRELHVHQHGVVYCSQQSHHAMLNRDITAAIKIAAIFLAKKTSIPLGPWAFGSKIEKEGPSKALASAIIGHAA